MNAARVVALLVAGGLGAWASGCGGGDRGTASPPPSREPAKGASPAGTTPPVATAPSATAPPPDAQPPESGEGGAGDEEPIRVPVTFDIRAGRLSPAEIRVPAYLTLQLEFDAVDGRVYHLLLPLPRRRSLAIVVDGRPGRSTAAVTIRGLRPGRYPIRVEGRPGGAIVAGAEPGP
jgi:hypothetical protein